MTSSHPGSVTLPTKENGCQHQELGTTRYLPLEWQRPSQLVQGIKRRLCYRKGCVTRNCKLDSKPVSCRWKTPAFTNKTSFLSKFHEPSPELCLPETDYGRRISLLTTTFLVSLSRVHGGWRPIFPLAVELRTKNSQDNSTHQGRLGSCYRKFQWYVANPLVCQNEMCYYGEYKEGTMENKLKLV